MEQYFPVGWTNPSQVIMFQVLARKYEMTKKKANGRLFTFLNFFTCFGVAR